MFPVKAESIREEFEEREKGFMSPFGCLSSSSIGRLKDEAPCPIRVAFQVDKVRIVYSNAFRRLKYKTQVFLAPLGDQYRTRLTHTLEVSQIARTIARALRLNEDLAEAISLGHDLGHTPFGHSGEKALQEVFSEEFTHNLQSLRVVDLLERNGKGLNLTHEVRNGILKHSKGHGKIIPEDPEETAFTTEGMIVRIADIMAYLNHDLDDAVRSGVISIDQIPPSCTKVLGQTHSQRSTNMIRDLVYSSKTVDGKLILCTSEPVSEAMAELRTFLYENVYRSPQVHNEFIKAKNILTELYFYFLRNKDLLRQQLKAMEMDQCYEDGESTQRIVCDFIASMTDRQALDMYSRFFVPTPVV